MATETEEALLRSRALRSRLFQKLLPATIDGASLSRNNVTPDSRNNVPIYRRGLLSSRNSVALDGRNNVAPGRYSGVAPERHRSVASRNSVALDGRHNVKPARSNRTIRGAAECLHTVPSFPSDVHYRHDIASNNIVAMCNGASSCPSCFPRHDLPWRTSHDCWETRGGLARRKKDIDFAFVWIKHELDNMQAQSQQIILDMVSVLKSIREVGHAYRHDQVVFSEEDDSINDFDTSSSN